MNAQLRGYTHRHFLITYWLRDVVNSTGLKRLNFVQYIVQDADEDHRNLGQ